MDVGATTALVHLAGTHTSQQPCSNMRSLNVSPTRWVGLFALLCALLALITPAGKQDVHWIRLFWRSSEMFSTKVTLLTCNYHLSERQKRKLQDMRPIWFLQAQSSIRRHCVYHLQLPIALQARFDLGQIREGRSDSNRPQVSFSVRECPPSPYCIFPRVWCG